MTETEATDVNQLFRDAQQDRAELPDGLSHRMIQDAARVQAGIVGSVVVSRIRVSRWRQLQDILGGWPGLGGLVAACATGIWLGFAPPETLPDPLQMMTRSEADMDLFYGDSLATVMLEES